MTAIPDTDRLAETNAAEYRRAAIRARLDAATEGPWHKDDGDFGCVTIGDYGWTTPPGVNAPEYDVDSPQGHADAELIAHAPSDLSWLLSELGRVERERDAYARAKQENDERFQLAAAAAGHERDEALSLVEHLQGQLAHFVAQHQPCKNLFQTCVTCRDAYGEPVPWPCAEAKRLGLGEEADDA